MLCPRCEFFDNFQIHFHILVLYGDFHIVRAHNFSILKVYSEVYSMRSIFEILDHCCQFICVSAEGTDIIGKSQMIEAFPVYIDTSLFPS